MATLAPRDGAWRSESRMREIRNIDAGAERVWAILTDFAAYPEWNPFIPRLGGTPREGARLDVRVEPPDGRGMNFKPVVLVADAGRELRWVGRLFVPRLFDGEHIFVIEPNEQGVRFVQREEFSGILVPLIWRSFAGSTRRGFEAMNAALKARAENSPTPST